MPVLDDVDRFFKELDKEFRHPLEVLITGAVAGSVMGYTRPSDDIDFEIRLESDSEEIREQLSIAIGIAARRIHLPAQYAEDIEGWGQIKLLDYREKATAYKKIGAINIKVMAPEHWSIGKLTRYLPLDREDLKNVLKETGIDFNSWITVIAEALRSSPLSDKSTEFKNHVIDFISHDAKKIWENLDQIEALGKFKKLAGLK